MYYSLERFQNEQLGSNASISSTVQLLCNLWHSTDDSNQEHINTINALIGSCSNWSDTDQSLELDQYVQCFFHNLLCSSLFRTLHSSNANSSHFHCSSHISWHLTGKGLNWQVFEILPQPTTWLFLLHWQVRDHPKNTYIPSKTLMGVRHDTLPTCRKCRIWYETESCHLVVHGHWLYPSSAKVSMNLS